MTQQQSVTTIKQGIDSVPTATLMLQEQEARSKELQRFNWLVLYVPLVLGTLLAVGLLGALGWFALTGEAASAERAQASGIADLFVTMICLAPMALMGAGFAGGGIFLLYWRRQKGSLLRERLQNTLRHVDERLNSADARAHVEQTRVVSNTRKYRSQFEALLNKLYYQAAQIAKWINEKLARNRD